MTTAGFEIVVVFKSGCVNRHKELVRTRKCEYTGEYTAIIASQNVKSVDAENELLSYVSLEPQPKLALISC